VLVPLTLSYLIDYYPERGTTKDHTNDHYSDEVCEPLSLREKCKRLLLFVIYICRPLSKTADAVDQYEKKVFVTLLERGSIPGSDIKDRRGFSEIRGHLEIVQIMVFQEEDAIEISIHRNYIGDFVLVYLRVVRESIHINRYQLILRRLLIFVRKGSLLDHVVLTLLKRVRLILNEVPQILKSIYTLYVGISR